MAAPSASYGDYGSSHIGPLGYENWIGPYATLECCCPPVPPWQKVKDLSNIERMRSRFVNSGAAVYCPKTAPRSR